MIPRIANEISRPVVNTGGWLTGLSDDLTCQDNVELAICFPITFQRKMMTGISGNIKYYGFPKSNDSKKDFIYILNDFKPDIVHIFGTEYKHTYDMVDACEESDIIDKTVINIQGLISVYCKHYFACLPGKVIKAYSIRDILKRKNLYNAAQDFKKRGKYEIEALKRVRHIIGRTDWDKAVTEQINTTAKYYFCNETLRTEFYRHKWDINSCERYSIFLSQWGYPIKGFHFMLEAMPKILERFPQAHIYITGENPIKANLKAKLKQSYYVKYIAELIKKYKLENYITFLGSLDEIQMCTRYLKSNVFVSASSIENSPNSVGEAMLLGVPVVSSDVGGVKNMLTHNEEGFVYPYDEPYMITHYVCRIFGDDCLAEKFSINAKKHAEITHNREINLNSVLKTYKEIGDNL